LLAIIKVENFGLFKTNIMRIVKELNQEVWHKFLEKNSGCSGVEFLLSPSWLEGVKKEGQEVLSLFVVRDLDYSQKDIQVEDVLSCIVLIKKPLKNGFFYWYGPRGPLLSRSLESSRQQEVAKFLIRAISRLNSKAIFLRFEPAVRGKNFWQEVFSQLFRFSFWRVKKAIPIQPKQTVVLDLKKSEEDLLTSMHQKTRYNIRLASKKGVKIEEGSMADFSDFWQLMAKTAQRDGFRIHAQEHYKNLLALDNNFIKLFFATYKNKRIATALVSFYGHKVTYLHGASSNEYRNLMAPHLLQWEIIRRAKEKGCNLYDFYGIDEKKWPGVTRFKLGFSLEKRSYVGTYDIVFHFSMYRLYMLARFLRLVKARIIK
jgi:lipid II:glycine glycyltransferase (peptidoglycan interpeptide bridge formation enzyme)